MINLVKRFFSEESGQGMTEYGLIIAVVAVMLIAVLATFKDNIKNLFVNAQNEMNPYNTVTP